MVVSGPDQPFQLEAWPAVPFSSSAWCDVLLCSCLAAMRASNSRTPKALRPMTACSVCSACPASSRESSGSLPKQSREVVVYASIRDGCCDRLRICCAEPCSSVVSFPHPSHTCQSFRRFETAADEASQTSVPGRKSAMLCYATLRCATATSSPRSLAASVKTDMKCICCNGNVDGLELTWPDLAGGLA